MPAPAAKSNAELEPAAIFARKPSTSRLDKSAEYSNPAVAPLLWLQKTVGNQFVGRMLRARLLQAKLTINQPGDEYEQEADRVADRVMRMESPDLASPARDPHQQDSPLQRKCAECEEEETVQRKADDGGVEVAPPIVDEVLASAGQPLDFETRAFMEPRFGYGFSQVRVHTDASAGHSAREVNARAYTVGQDIVFGAGQFAPDTPVGQRLLAHELTHVVQQSTAMIGGQRSNTLNPSHSAVVQRAPGKEAGTESGVSDSPYPEEELVLRYAIGARDLGKLVDGTMLYNAKYWKAIGISDRALVVGPFTSDMGNIFYVYQIRSTDEKKGTHTFSRGSHLGGWGEAGMKPELRKELAKVEGGKVFEFKSTGLIPPTGGAIPQPERKQVPQGTGVAAPTQGAGPSPTEASQEELTPHRKKWMTAGRENMKREINSLFNSIQKLKAKRIDVWEKNARIKDPKPIKDALEVAVQVVGYGMGGVVGGILTKSLAHGLLTEFVKESALKSTALLAEFIFQHAVEPAEELMNEAMIKALNKDKEANAKSALASKGDLLDCYVEAESLQTISEEKAQNEEFNSKVDTKFSSDIVLADEVAVFDALFDKLRSEPKHFLRELSVGLLRLKEEMYLEEQAKKYGGSVERLLKEDPKIHETEERSGNLLVLPPVMSRSLGNYYDTPDVSFDSFYALATEINSATLMELSGTKVKDLPVTLAFRFWATSPFRNLLERVTGLPGGLCKVWFERRSDGVIWVDFDASTLGDDVSDGIEWLASYYMYSVNIPAGHDLSTEERHKYAPQGARKLYELIKDKPVTDLQNFDIF